MDDNNDPGDGRPPRVNRLQMRGQAEADIAREDVQVRQDGIASPPPAHQNPIPQLRQLGDEPSPAHSAHQPGTSRQNVQANVAPVVAPQVGPTSNMQAGHAASQRGSEQAGANAAEPVGQIYVHQVNVAPVNANLSLRPVANRRYPPALRAILLDYRNRNLPQIDGNRLRNQVGALDCDYRRAYYQAINPNLQRPNDCLMNMHLQGEDNGNPQRPAPAGIQLDPVQEEIELIPGPVENQPGPLRGRYMNLIQRHYAVCRNQNGAPRAANQPGQVPARNAPAPVQVANQQVPERDANAPGPAREVNEAGNAIQVENQPAQAIGREDQFFNMAPQNILVHEPRNNNFFALNREPQRAHNIFQNLHRHMGVEHEAVRRHIHMREALRARFNEDNRTDMISMYDNMGVTSRYRAVALENGQPVNTSNSWSHTKSNSYMIKHTWSIENFVQHLQRSTDIENQSRTNSTLMSSIFSSPEDESLRFYMSLRAGGASQNGAEYLSMYLHFMYKADIQDTYSAVISVYEVERSSNIPIEMFCKTFRPGYFYGWQKAFLVYRNRFTAANNKFTLRLELKIVTGTMLKSSLEDIKPNASSVLDQSQLQSVVSDDLSRLLQSSKHSDATLCFGGMQHPVHRAILAAQSPVFAAMFGHDTEECRLNHVDITDIATDVMSVLLAYIYTGRTPDKEDLTTDLLIAADKYQVDSLKIICEESLSEILEVDTVCTLLLLADIHNASTLKTNCFNFITEHPTEVIQTEAWREMGQARPELTTQAYHDLAHKFGHLVKRRKLTK